MAQTWIPNTDCVFSLDNAVPTLTDFSAECSKVSMDINFQNGGFYVFGLAGQQASEGSRSYTGSFTVRGTTETTELHQVMAAWMTPGAGNKAGQRSLRIQEPDGTSGSIQWDGEILIDSYNLVTQDAGGDGTPSERQAQYRVDGEPTLTVIV